MRLKFFAPLNHSDRASNSTQEEYKQTLDFPVPHILLSGDEAFGCDGTETFEKVWPLEVLAKIINISDTRGDPALELDISCPLSIVEQFMLNILPRAIPYSRTNGDRKFQSPVTACLRSSLSMEEKGDGGPLRVRKTEPYAQDLPVQGGDQSLDENMQILSLQFQPQTSTKQDLCKNLQFEIEEGPLSCPYLCDEDIVIGSNNQPEADRKLSDVPVIKREFEEQYRTVPLHLDCGEGSITMAENYTGHDHKNLEEPTRDSARDLLNRYDSRLKGDGQNSQRVSEWSNVLKKFSLDSSVEDITQHQVQVPGSVNVEVKFGDVSILDVRSQTVADCSIPSSVVFPELGSRIESHSNKPLSFTPEMMLKHPRLNELMVPHFSTDQIKRVGEDVFKNLSPRKTLSKNDIENNHAGLRLQKAMEEDQLRVPIPHDTLFTKKSSNAHLLLSRGEDSSSLLSKSYVIAISDDDAEEVPHLPAEKSEVPSPSNSIPESGRFPRIADEETEKEQSELSTLTDEKLDSPTTLQLQSAAFHNSSMASVLSLMKKTKNGAAQEHIVSYDENEAIEDPLWDVHRSRRLDPCAILVTSHQEKETSSASTFGACSDKALLHVASPGTSSQLLSPGQHSALEELHGYAGQGPRVILITNVLEPEGPVLCQRRTFYRRLLGLENADLQVVERERQLPLDLILSPSTCLIIYTEESIKLFHSNFRGPTPEAFLSFIIDTVIDRHMKAMSFSFEMCFMIFEGKPAFTSAILQITQKLCIAAAGFGIRVQCFISGDQTCTYDLVLNCIKRISRRVKRPYDSHMSDCLTEGEAFLSQFPALNTLAAHAILSLRVPLATFMSWTHGDQVSSLEGFDVPTESLALFKSQCEYEKAAGQGQDSFIPWQCDQPGIRNRYGEAGVGDLYAEPWLCASEFLDPEIHQPNLEELPLLSPAPKAKSEFELDFNIRPGTEDHNGGLCFPRLTQTFKAVPNFFNDIPPDQCTISRSVDQYWEPEQRRSSEFPGCDTSHLQPPYPLRLASNLRKPGYIQRSLDEWLDSRKRQKHNILEAELKLDCGLSEDLRLPSFPLRTQPDPAPIQASKSEAPDSIRNRDANFSAKNPLLKNKAGKRKSSALQLYRHQKGLSRDIPKRLKAFARPHHSYRVADQPSRHPAPTLLSRRLQLFVSPPSSRPG